MIAMEESSINICIDMFRFFQAQPIVSHFIQMKQRFFTMIGIVIEDLKNFDLDSLNDSCDNKAVVFYRL